MLHNRMAAVRKQTQTYDAHAKQPIDPASLSADDVLKKRATNPAVI